MKLFRSLYIVCVINIVRVWAQEAPPRDIPVNVIEDAFEMAERIISDRNAPEAPATADSGVVGEIDVAPTIGGRKPAGPPITLRPPVSPPPAPAAVARHQFFLASKPKTRKLQAVQEPFELATSIVSRILSLTPEECERLLPNANLSATKLSGRVSRCEDETLTLNCQASDRYRTFDGTCNNLQNPSRGMASSCFQRLVPSNYADGISQKRVAASGNPLPPPRSISLAIHNHANRPNIRLSHMFTFFGQFLDHELALTPQSNTEILDCCEVEAPPADCDPIVIQETDPFYGEFGITCLSNFRSAVCSTCRYGPREQINQLTAYIDASQVYGLNLNESRALRTLDGTGTMRSINVPEVGELLPTSFMPEEDFCSDQDPNLDCFQAGDTRVNENPALTTLHTLFVRDHNRIARRFREINPSWDDETLFQETRRIIGAEMQMITYNEFLPLVLGADIMKKYDLNVLWDDDARTSYNQDVDATILNEFATAAYRFGHTLIDSFLKDTRGIGEFLRDSFSFPFGLYTGQLEGLVGGLMRSPAQTYDRNIVADVTNHVYQFRGNRSGMDLVSLNLNRGRDHGIPGYTTLFEFCSNSTIRDWNDLNKMIDADLITLLRTLYERVEDIDLFTGGLLEQPIGGAVVGPTFACIIGTQFQRLKFGDRFYFEHRSQAGSFTRDQLRELKKVTLGKMICDNLRITETNKNALLQESKENPVESCDSKPVMNLNVWKMPTPQTGRGYRTEGYKGKSGHKGKSDYGGYKGKGGYKGTSWKRTYNKRPYW